MTIAVCGRCEEPVIRANISPDAVRGDYSRFTIPPAHAAIIARYYRGEVVAVKVKPGEWTTVPDPEAVIAGEQGTTDRWRPGRLLDAQSWSPYDQDRGTGWVLVLRHICGDGERWR